VGFTRSQRLYGLGAILFVALAICAHNFSNFGAPSFIAWLVVAGVAYLLAIREFYSAPRFPRRVLVIGLMFAAAWHFLFLLKAPGPDDDIHRYLWDGRVQRLGYNPYVLVPNDPAVAGLHTAETRSLNHPDLPSPYPPGAQLFFRAITSIHESVFALKVAFLICGWAIAVVLLVLVRRSGQGEHWVLVYAWNPLLAVEMAGNGHIDIVGVLFLLMSVAALWRRWRSMAAVAFALAVAVKFLPIVLVPLYWRRLRLRDALLAVLVFALLYWPFLNRGHVPTGSLGAYVQSFRFNGPVFAELEGFLPPQAAAGLAILGGFVTAIWMKKRSEERSFDALAWPMAATLLCAPVVYPWYLLWLLPFLRSLSTLPIIIWTVSIIPTYYVWHLRTMGRPWILPTWVMPLEYGAIAVAGVVVGLLRLARPAELNAEAVSDVSRPAQSTE
jgi:alpha-1,6-mannosyltransferase